MTREETAAWAAVAPLAFCNGHTFGCRATDDAAGSDAMVAAWLVFGLHGRRHLVDKEEPATNRELERRNREARGAKR